MDEYLTVQEAAETLRISRESVIRAVKRGHLTAFKYGSLYRIRESDLQAFIAAYTVSSGVPRRRHPRS